MATAPKKAPVKAAQTASVKNTECNYAKAMIMASLVGKGSTMAQIEETADYIVERCYGSTKG